MPGVPFDKGEGGLPRVHDGRFMLNPFFAEQFWSPVAHITGKEPTPLGLHPI